MMRLAGFFMSAVLLVVLFQNCSQSNFRDAVEQSVSRQGSGNGGVYEGKLEVFNLKGSSACPTLGANGKPLPAQVILALETASGPVYQLARDNCRDLQPPATLSSSEVQRLPNATTLTFRGGTFGLVQPDLDPFAVIAGQCPSGMTPIPNAVRTNLMKGTQDLGNLQFWQDIPGTRGYLNGTMASMPVYLVQRDDPNNLDAWRRVQQVVSLKANSRYLVTFFARPGSVNTAFVSGVGGGNDFMMAARFDLATGAFSTDGAQKGTTLVGYSRRYDAGWILTIAFTTPNVSTQIGLGVGPYASPIPPGLGKLGDSIYATAAQLEELSTICR